MTKRGWILFGAMGLIWGIPYLLIKIAVGELHPATLVLVRTAIGALLLIPIAAARGSLSPLRPYWKPILLFAAVEVALPWVLLADAERRIPSSLTGLLLATVPFIGAVLARFTGSDERLGTRRLVGLLVGLVGVAALLKLDVAVRDLGAVGEVGLVALGYAIGPMIIARRLAGVPSIGVIAASLGLTALVYVPLGLSQLPATLPSLRVIVAVTILGVVCTALAFLLFFRLIAEVGPVRATVITYINPAVALVFGITILSEPFTIGAGIGFILILVGSFLATRRGAPRPVSAVLSSVPAAQHGR
jgi:drug/metabolite transporter (DMT)-like permease